MSRARRILAEGRHLRLIDEDGWEYSERVGASGVVVILPLTDQGEVVMVEQYRRPLKKRVLELPAGLAGDLPGQEQETLEQAAARELEEETGFRAGKLQRLLSGPSAAGSSSTVIHLFLATELRRVGCGGGDEDEDIEVHVVPLKDCDAFIAAKVSEGCLADPKLYAGLYFAARR